MIYMHRELLRRLNNSRYLLKRNLCLERGLQEAAVVEEKKEQNSVITALKWKMYARILAFLRDLNGI